MSAEELVLAAEFKFKELKTAAGHDLLAKALARDPGYSRAHLVAGIQDFTAGHYARLRNGWRNHRARRLSGRGLLLSRHEPVRLGQEQHAERNLYYIWPLSAYYGEREYHLGRLAFLRKDAAGAAAHLERAMVFERLGPANRASCWR